MTVRATGRGAQRYSLDGTTADVLICGASFAGLAVARELAGCGASVLLVDRYEIGERATSACAAPTPWLHALGLGDAIRREIPHMTFTTPHGSVRYRLPWSWSAFDYRRLCQLLYAQSDAVFHTAKVHGLAGPEVPAVGAQIAVATDRGVLRAPLVVDALGWRRVLGHSGHQPPESPLSRGLEVHPEGDGEDLDVWIERSLVRRGYGWRVPADGEARVGVASYAPGDHVRDPTVALAERLGLEAIRYQGNWFPHRLRPATEDPIFFVGDSAGHCFPLSGEGIRTAFYFGIACGRELTAVLAEHRSRTDAIGRYAAFSHGHRRAFAIAGNLQRIIPALPPRLLMTALRLCAHQPLINRSFGWYLDQAHPSFATDGSADDDRLTAMAEHYRRPGWFTTNVFNRVVGAMTRLGLSVYGSRVLEVRGRTSGVWRRTPVNLLRHDGADYLVAPRGHTQWVKNLRASGTGRLVLGRRTSQFAAQELSDNDKPPVLRLYLKKWKFEVGAFFDGVGPDSSDQELRRIAPDHPVFRVSPN